MGTSIWHKSPETEAWRRVRELYAGPYPSAPAVVSRITAALDADTRRGMSDAAVAACMGTMVEGAQLVGADGLVAALDRLGVTSEPPALQFAAGLRERAESLVAGGGLASCFGDLALEAVGAASLALASGRASGTGLMAMPLAVAEDNLERYGREGRLNEVCALFAGHHLDRCFRHFVARDIGEFIGGEGLPTVSDANRLEDEVAGHGREAWGAMRLADCEGLLASIASVAPEERVQLLQPIMATAVSQGLGLLGAGGL